jgi:hypothetical protein
MWCKLDEVTQSYCNKNNNKKGVQFLYAHSADHSLLCSGIIDLLFATEKINISYKLQGLLSIVVGGLFLLGHCVYNIQDVSKNLSTFAYTAPAFSIKTVRKLPTLC